MTCFGLALAASTGVGCTESSQPAGPGASRSAPSTDTTAVRADGGASPSDPSSTARGTGHSPTASLPAGAVSTGGGAAPAPTSSGASNDAANTPIVVPPSVAATDERRPFVLLLHGYQGNGASIARHFGLAELASRERFVWAAPDGAADSKGQRFWNTGPSCCDFEHSGVDHIGQLRSLIERAASDSHVDRSTLVVVGYSNGGFMAHRLACEVEGIVAVGSIAGAPPTDLSGCKNRPAVVVQIHGDADRVVRFEGGRVLDRDDVEPHPGPVKGMARWAEHLGCLPAAKPAGLMDLEPRIDGDETERLRFSPCEATLELWRVKGGGHDVAANQSAFARLLRTLVETRP